MTSKRLAYALAASIILGGSALAAAQGNGNGNGKGNGGGGGGGGGGKTDDTAFVPEILYQHNARRSQDIRLTDITGEPYVTVHSAAQAELDGFTLSDEADRLIAFAEYGDVYLTSWTSDTVTIGAKLPVSERESRGDGAGRVAFLEFSYDSRYLVFTESSARPDSYSSGSARRMWIYDVSNGGEPTLLLDNMVAWDVHWSPSEEDVLYFTGASLGLNDPEHLYRYDLNSGAIDPVLDAGTDFTSRYFDITGPSANVSPRFAVGYDPDLTRDRIRIFDLDGNPINSSWIAYGDILTFDCTGTQLIHKDEGATGGGGLTITQVNGSASTFRDRRGTHSVSDWMPKRDC